MQKLFLLLLLVALVILTFTPAVGDQDQAIKIYDKYGCNECHAISALKIGVELTEIVEEDDWGDDFSDEEAVFSPDLSNVGLVRDAQWISKWLRKKVDNDGVMHKKRFQGSKEERQALSLWLETLKYDLPEGVGVAIPTPEVETEEP